MPFQDITITEDDAAPRLDRWLRRRFIGATQGQIEKWLRGGLIKVDGKKAHSAQRLTKGMRVRVPDFLQAAGAAPPRPLAARTQTGSLIRSLQRAVLFEDRDVLVLNKPAGLAVQGGSGITESLDDVLPHFAHKPGETPKLVHRLDRETSGVLVVARSALAARALSEHFRGRTAHKLYLAVTLGVPRQPSGQMQDFLLRQGVRVVAGSKESGQQALTRFHLVDALPAKAGLLALAPHTGRTHQLRVQLALRGTPILGDPLYAADYQGQSDALKKLGAQRSLHLHAARLVVPHPRQPRQILDIAAPVPPAFQGTVKALGLHVDGDMLAQVFAELWA